MRNDLLALFGLKHNPFGGQQTQQYQMPKLDDQHLEPANEQGLRKVKDSGHEVLQNHANNFGIEDNSSLLSGNSAAALGQPLTPVNITGNQPSALGNLAKGAVKDEAVAAVADDSGILGALAALL